MKQSCLLVVCLLASVAWSNAQNEEDPILDDEMFESRLLGGTAATVAEPYVVSIKGKDIAAADVPPCAGAIVQSNMVLTTAFCVLNTVTGDVFAGSITLGDEAVQKVQISSVTKHPDFRKNTMENDIAIVKVLPSFDFTKPTIKAAIIASGKLVDKDALKKDVTMFGWGVTDATSADANSATLNSLALPAGKDKDCASALKNVYFKMPSTTFCLNATAAKTACKGDFGSPVSAVGLDSKKPTEVNLVGLVSRWVKCPNKKGAPLVVTKFSPFFKWLKEQNGPVVT